MAKHEIDASGTTFQQECRWAVEAVFKKHAVAVSFQPVVGEHENYLRALVSDEPERLEVFIYEDEAGFFHRKEWVAFEAADFRSKRRLLEALVEELENAITQAAQ